MEPNRQYLANELQQMGLSTNYWNGQVVNIGGQQYKVVDPGNGTRVFQPLGGSSAGGSGFNFDWSVAEREALEKLKPYYEQKLADAKGDVSTAKRIIEEDYAKGVRRSDEDQTRSDQYATEDYQSAIQAADMTAEQENRETRGALNQRGVLVGEQSADQSGGKAPESGYAKEWYMNPLNQQQQLRRLAIERALQRQQEAAGLTSTRTKEDLTTARQRAVEQQDIQFPRFERALNEEKKEKAVTQMAPLKYEQEYQKYRYLNNLG